MDSLYGGHQGNSFTLRAEFASVGKMVAAFKGGPNYTDVWYDEFVIINTKNKNDKDNGKIFRRGYDYQNNMGGAIQVGQVVGPSSGTPYFSIGGLGLVKGQSTRPLSDNEYRRYPIRYDDTNNKYVTNKEEDGDIGYFNFGTPVDLVPGKTTDNSGKVEYNDTIKYTWCNIRNDNADSDSWFYVGWQIPYLVTEYDIHTNSPYDEDGLRLEDASTIERIQDDDNKPHPYYAKWNIGLPRGIKGDALRNLRVITPQPEDTIYPYDAIQVDKKTGLASLKKDAQSYPGKDTDVKNKYQIVVFDYYVFDKQQNPTPYMIYLGDFNTIKSIDVDKYGTISIAYTSQETEKIKNKICWIDNITLNLDVKKTSDDNSGHFVVNFNNGKEPFETTLQWLHDMSITDEGTVIYNYVGHLPVVEEKKISWIKDVSLDNETGKMTINYNNDSHDHTDKQQTFNLAWVKNINIAKNGVITLQYTGNKNDAILNDIKIKNIIKATASDNGVVTFTYNTTHRVGDKDVNDTTTLQTKSSDGSDIDFHIQTVKDVSLSPDIAEDKHIKITYNTAPNKPVSIGPSLNYIADTIVRPTDWHLLVLYGDPEHRPTSENIDSFPGKWVHGPELSTWRGLMLDSEKGTTNGIYWCDLGTIKDQAGILVGFNLTDSQIQNGFEYNDSKGEKRFIEGGYTKPLDWLNERLKGGLTGEDQVPGGKSVVGKLVTYTPPEIEGVKRGAEFFAFDYNTREWFSVGTISDDGTRDVAWAASTEADSVAARLNIHGLMFYQQLVPVSTDALPQFWAIN